MRATFLSLFILFSYVISAQNIEYANLRIHYATKFKKWEEIKKISEDEKILDIGTKVSKFYSLWEAKNEEIKDSILKRGGTFQEVQNALGSSPYPRSYQLYAIYKNYPQRGILTFTDRIVKNYIYEEKLEVPQWQILTKNDTCSIAGYHCQKAQAKFRGRLWNAWFTEELPINDGPWKLCGLPGLILKAEDTKKDFSFECIQIEKINEYIIMPKHKYLKCNRKKMEQIYMLLGKDPNAYFMQLGYAPQPGYDMQGKVLKYNKTAILIEY